MLSAKLTFVGWLDRRLWGFLPAWGPSFLMALENRGLNASFDKDPLEGDYWLEVTVVEVRVHITVGDGMVVYLHFDHNPHLEVLTGMISIPSEGLSPRELGERIAAHLLERLEVILDWRIARQKRELFLEPNAQFSEPCPDCGGQGYVTGLLPSQGPCHNAPYTRDGAWTNNWLNPGQ